MRGGRIWILVAVGLFVGFWVLRALFSGSSPQSVQQPTMEPLPQAAEAQPKPMLVEPPTRVAGTPPLRLLQRMYGHIEDLCWEHSEPAYDADSRRISLDFGVGDEPPVELLELFESGQRGYEDYQYRWFGSRRLLLIHQEWFVTPGGREGPRASTSEIFKFESSDGSTFWGRGEGAAVYPCDAIQ